ncbi:MAG TPA: class I SAM-dependent rRNA methyltransferase [Vulgatibacter sp.]
MNHPVVPIDPALSVGRSLRAGHPWLFTRAILGKPPHLPAGAIVDVEEAGRFVARGYYDPHSHIRVRVLTRDPLEKIDPLFWRRRIGRAWLLRDEVIVASGDADSYRVVHGESDGLPGLVVDRYAGFLVTKLYSAGLVPHRDSILAALRSEVPGVTGIFGREGVDDDSGRGGVVHFGEAPPERVEIREHGAGFLVDVRGGQKTGFFLDQRENRFALRRYARGREALNCFGYTGGFSVHLALGGARRVTTVDQDRDAIGLAEENFRLNGIDPDAHDFRAEDVFDALAAAKRMGQSWDLVVLDPPAFAKSQKTVDAAIDGYASLNRAALSVLRPGGILVSCSCSARVSAEAFAGAIAQAADKARVELQLVEQRYQAPDHPISLSFPEGRYLKVYVFRRI